MLKVVDNNTMRFASHYDVLGVTPKANQSEIKSAYYKLSMLHHPDKTNDDASLKKFRAITEAYEILGNVRLKKMYDKGLFGGLQSTYKPEQEPPDPILKFYKSRSTKQVAPKMTDGRTPIYDFDAWSKEHYSSIFQKTQFDKYANKRKRQTQPEREKTVRQEAHIYLLTILVASIFMYAMQEDEKLDVDRTKEDTNVNPKEDANHDIVYTT